ncbi:glycosyltransferase family 2 protein [Vibrio sp. PNB22_8_1]|uniref:glycosyltransferase family 2 protein n=1 Tax=unclassified Vibrio TaxID=2614977 RepID=UPI00406A9ED0
MAVFISVVSHGHSSLIQELRCLNQLCEDFIVVVKSNIAGDDFNELASHDNVFWINEAFGKGFGQNNNLVFSFCQQELGMKEEDYFVVFNPDVHMETSELSKLIYLMENEKSKLSAINLYKDKQQSEYDNSIRMFPSLPQFVKSFLGFGNDSILDKSKISERTKVDWAAGSFLAFTAEHYRALGGFDESYFMYCEDIDICFRSNKIGESVIYYPQVHAYHLAKHANRKLLSKHFLWHVSSVARFLLTTYNLRNSQTSIR